MKIMIEAISNPTLKIISAELSKDYIMHGQLQLSYSCSRDYAHDYGGDYDDHDYDDHDYDDHGDSEIDFNLPSFCHVISISY